MLIFVIIAICLYFVSYFIARRGAQDIAFRNGYFTALAMLLSVSLTYALDSNISANDSRLVRSFTFIATMASLVHIGTHVYLQYSRSRLGDE